MEETCQVERRLVHNRALSPGLCGKPAAALLGGLWRCSDHASGYRHRMKAPALPKCEFVIAPARRCMAVAMYTRDGGARCLQHREV